MSGGSSIRSGRIMLWKSTFGCLKGVIKFLGLQLKKKIYKLDCLVYVFTIV